MLDKKRSFWTSLPGLLTAFAAVITAVTGLYVAITQYDHSASTKQVPSASVSPPGELPSKIEKKQKLPMVERDQLFNKRAVIDDPDGYTNIRSMKSTSSDVITIVYTGDEFYTYAQNDNWWQIKTRDGKVGYMQVSRIRIIGDR